MPGATTTTDNYHNNDDNSYNQHNNNNFNIMDGGNGVYTIHAMGGAGSNPDRYLSNESLETNSSGESSSNLGNIPHRKVGHYMFATSGLARNFTEGFTIYANAYTFPNQIQLHLVKSNCFKPVLIQV
jgi:hypothetical protein